MAEVAPKLPAWAQRLHRRRVLGRLQRKITGHQGMDYIFKATRSLVSQGLIKEPLTVKELFAITHIHVHDGLVISIRELGALLPNHELPGQRSYGFFGQLPYGPPKRFRVREVELVAAGVLNGIPHRRDLDGPSLNTIYSEDDRPLEIRRLGDFHRA